MPRNTQLSGQKKKKAETLERFSSRVKNFGEFRREKNLIDFVRAQLRPKSAYISAFFILHDFLISRIGRLLVKAGSL
jgi:hypothetical protein